MKRPRKVNNGQINKNFLERRENYCVGLGHKKQQWVSFCEIMLEKGFELYLYEAQRTVSKYITVSDGRYEYKVRFSNHKPIFARKINGDCDFFVGRTNLKTTHTAQAVLATMRFFESVKHT